jgi:hypothetical protein
MLLMRTWLDATTWSESRDYALRHPEVTSPDNQGALEEAIRRYGSHPMTARYLDLFRTVQVHGIERSYPLLAEAVARSWLAVSGWAESRTFFEAHSLVLTDDHTELHVRDLVRWYPADDRYPAHLALLQLAQAGLAAWGYRYLTETDPAVRQQILLQPLSNRPVDGLRLLVPALRKLAWGVPLSHVEQADVTALRALELILSGVPVDPMSVVTAPHRRQFVAGQRLTWIRALNGIRRQLRDETEVPAKLRALTMTVLRCT